LRTSSLPHAPKRVISPAWSFHVVVILPNVAVVCSENRGPIYACMKSTLYSCRQALITALHLSHPSDSADSSGPTSRGRCLFNQSQVYCIMTLQPTVWVAGRRMDPAQKLPTSFVLLPAWDFGDIMAWRELIVGSMMENVSSLP